MKITLNISKAEVLELAKKAVAARFPNMIIVEEETYYSGGLDLVLEERVHDHDAD